MSDDEFNRGLGHQDPSREKFGSDAWRGAGGQKQYNDTWANFGSLNQRSSNDGNRAGNSGGGGSASGGIGGIVFLIVAAGIGYVYFSLGSHPSATAPVDTTAATPYAPPQGVVPDVTNRPAPPPVTSTAQEDAQSAAPPLAATTAKEEAPTAAPGQNSVTPQSGEPAKDNADATPLSFSRGQAIDYHIGEKAVLDATTLTVFKDDPASLAAGVVELSHNVIPVSNGSYAILRQCRNDQCEVSLINSGQLIAGVVPEATVRILYDPRKKPRLVPENSDESWLRAQ